METETVKIIGLDVPLSVFTAWEYEQFIRAKHESGRLEEEKLRLNRDNLALEIQLDAELLKVMKMDFGKKVFGDGENSLSEEAKAKAKQEVIDFERALREKADILNTQEEQDKLKNFEITEKWRTLWAHRVLAPSLNFEDFEASLTATDKTNIYTLWEKKGFFAGA
jgi:hypothetical protein